jgi:hypothetical protein
LPKGEVYGKRNFMINYFVDYNSELFKFDDKTGKLPDGWRYNYKTKEWKADDTVIARWYAIDPFDFGYEYTVIPKDEIEATIKKLTRGI